MTDKRSVSNALAISNGSFVQQTIIMTMKKQR